MERNGTDLSNPIPIQMDMMSETISPYNEHQMKRAILQEVPNGNEMMWS